jgi:hypothetical protein
MFVRAMWQARSRHCNHAQKHFGAAFRCGDQNVMCHILVGSMAMLSLQVINPDDPLPMILVI